MITTPILVFPDWSKEFHVHVDASSFALGVILAHPGAGDIDHPIAFASRKLSTSEMNYTTIEREGLGWSIYPAPRCSNTTPNAMEKAST